MIFDINKEETYKNIQILKEKQKQIDLNSIELISYYAHQALHNKPEDDFNKISITCKEDNIPLVLAIFEEDLRCKDIDSIMLSRINSEKKTPYYINDIQKTLLHVKEFPLFNDSKLEFFNTDSIEADYKEKNQTAMSDERFVFLKEELEDMLNHRRTLTFSLHSYLVHNIIHAFNQGMDSFTVQDGVFNCKDKNGKSVNHLLDKDFMQTIDRLNEQDSSLIDLKRMSNYLLKLPQFKAFMKLNLKIDEHMTNAIMANYEKIIINHSIEQVPTLKAPVSSRRI